MTTTTTVNASIAGISKPLHPWTDSSGRRAASATSQPMGARPATGLGAIDQLLRDRGAILNRIEHNVALADLARVMLLTIAVASAVFGAAIGMYRGGLQIVYAAVKLPLLMLFTAAICAPSLTAFNAALDRPSSIRQDLALVLSSLALGSLLLVAQTPLILLAGSLSVGYHSLILLVFGCTAVAGLASLLMLSRGVRSSFDGRHRSATMALLVVFCVVGAQMAWTLRPYVVRPRTPEVPFVRDVEGSLLRSIVNSVQSARGIFVREYAPLPGENAPDLPPQRGDIQ